MEDRELLELAAKAAGVFLTPDSMNRLFPKFVWDDGDAPTFADGGLFGTVAWYGDDGKPAGTEKLLWSPLTDDGDSMRLAVALRLDVLHNEPQDNDSWVMAGSHIDHTEEVDGEASRAAATRRAIVRAAAALATAPAA